MLILEDDPYYFMTFEEEPIPSFYSMDIEGRVIRFDSFSKIVAPGVRMGYVTGPRPILQKLLYHLQASVQQSSSISQVMLEKLFRHWGNEGFKQHVEEIRKFYKRKRDLMTRAVEKHLTGLCEWFVPSKIISKTLIISNFQDDFSFQLEACFTGSRFWAWKTLGNCPKKRCAITGSFCVLGKLSALFQEKTLPT